MNRVAWTLALAAGLLVGSPAARAQETVSLDRVEELAGQGRTGEARALLLQWWSDGLQSATRREVQRGLWLRGRLTVDPAQADLDFQRLVIEYPGGPFTDQALFRLAQSAFAAGDSAGAVAQVNRLAREYPGSPARREAEAWLAMAGPAPPPLNPIQPGPADSVDTAAPEGADAPDVAGGHFAVQLGAFRSAGRAEALRRRAADAGFEARLVTVPGSSLIRVRVGVFDSQEGADAILQRLRGLGFTAALARDAHLEELARR